MTSLLESFVRTPLAGALGWTIFHSLWQGAAIALALAIALRMLRSSNTRYVAALLALVGMTAAFGITFALLRPQPVHLPVPAPAGFVQAAPSQDLTSGPSFADHTAAFLPWATPLWMAGVFCFYLRSLGSWMLAQRLRRKGVCGAPEKWQQTVARLKARLRVTRPVLVAESCLLEVPVVLGYLRPVILLPAGALIGLPSDQIEAILLHELAHVRRGDYFVNLLQTCVESLFFYHPAAWWISGTIRDERENCCDDMVVSVSGDARRYAGALTAFEHYRASALETMLPATGGNLVKRIERLMRSPQAPRAAVTPVFSAAMLMLAASLILGAWQTTQTQPQTQAANPASGDTESAWQKWLQEDVAYIITDAERATFKGLQTDRERAAFVEEFWLRRDPTPGTVENEYKEEHYRRIAFANQHFAENMISGWKTDRGRIYITYGPPDEIDSHPSGGSYERPAVEGGGTVSTYPFEDWRYRYIEGIGNSINIEFVDRAMNGEYHMTMDPSAKDRTAR